MTAVDQLPAWKALERHACDLQGRHLRELCIEDPGRGARWRGRVGALQVDYAKHRVREETFALLFALAEEVALPAQIARLFAGERINSTEQRAVLHMALRGGASSVFRVDGADVMPEILATRARMRALCDALRAGAWLGAAGEPVTDVVNIGIGGSDLGPYMVCEALAPYAAATPRVHFVSNIDGAQISRVLAPLDPRRTLFIVNSKSFGTLETKTNAETAKHWLLQSGLPSEAVMARHFLAVSANQTALSAFGIPEANRFPIWDWVGGRYSLWSATGLAIAIAVGMDAFEALLSGARAMDEHFRDTPMPHNLPVRLGLLGVWYADFLGAASHAVLPYDDRLRSLPAYLQQADMESNGKRVTRDGHPVTWSTGPIVWGAPGTNGQHAFFQLMHQGTHLIPADFIGCIRPHHPHADHHRALLANLLAQSEALMRGRTEAETRAALAARGLDAARVDALTPHNLFPGNQPSTTILLDALTPEALGSLIALYEHRIFTQGAVWGINSFDQWGVELGKIMAQTVIGELASGEVGPAHDPWSAALIAACLPGAHGDAVSNEAER
ncbi:MAG: glucose-6-phosphate isomerase 2 [Pseudomonadota bacterium]